MTSPIVLWILRLVAAGILFATVVPKLTAAPDAVALFSFLKDRLGLPLEPYGRIGLGIVEAVAAVLVLIPATTPYGAVVGLGLMAGALMTHLVFAGIQLQHLGPEYADGGVLFGMAVVGLLSCAALVWLVLLRGR